VGQPSHLLRSHVDAAAALPDALSGGLAFAIASASVMASASATAIAAASLA